MQPQDLRWLYAAWQLGGLRDLAGTFEEDLTKEEFSNLVQAVLTEFDDNTTFTAPFIDPIDKTEKIGPVGILMMRAARKARFGMETVWFPWASPRNKFESWVNLLHNKGKDFLFLEFARESERPFWERLARLKLVRRVGSVYGMYPDGPALTYQSTDK